MPDERNSAHEFSVFCVFDNIVISKVGELADFSFVSLQPGKRTKLALLPYVGPMWYHRVAVEHMLYYGIASWDNILFSFSSTGKLPAHCFRTPIQTMESAWTDKAFGKYNINSMISLWDINSTHVCHAKTSNDTITRKGAT